MAYNCVNDVRGKRCVYYDPDKVKFFDITFNNAWTVKIYFSADLGVQLCTTETLEEAQQFVRDSIVKREE